MSDLAKEPAVPLMQRYAKSLSFEARRAYDMLMDLRKRVPLVPPGTPLPEIEEPQNETNPCPEMNTPPSATGAALHTTEPCEQAESEAELLLPQSNNRHLAILPDH